MSTLYEVYNVNAGEVLGIYEAASADHALDVMARDYGFADYADCIAEYRIAVEDAKAELRITEIPLPHGWTLDRVKEARAKWDIADNMVPIATAMGVCAWGTINSVRLERAATRHAESLRTVLS